MKKKIAKQSRKAVVYARVSSKEQEKEGYSIPAQKKLLEAYAADHGLDVVNEYIDVETAKRAGRTGFTEMLAFLKDQAEGKQPEDRCRIILVEKTDRLYRNFKDWVILDELDLEIHLVKDNTVQSANSRSNEKFMHAIKVVMAKNYIDNLSEETKKGMLEKAEQGIYPSYAPIGYVNVICNSKRFIQPDPAVAHLVKMLFTWYSTGTYSIAQLAEKAYEEGLVSRNKKKKIPRSVIHEILGNPIYYGDFLWNDKLYKGTHDPIIEKELFDCVQDVLAGKGHSKAQQRQHEWAFQGLLTCGHCGCAMTAEMKKGKYVYYHCTGNRGKCPEKYVREEEIARQFGDALKVLQLDDESLQLVVKTLKQSHADEKQFHNEAISSLQGQYQRLKDRLDAMYLDKLDGQIDTEFFERKKEEWRKEQNDILYKLERHQNANRSYIDEGVRLLELLQDAVSIYESRDMTEKRKILEFVCSNSNWKDGKLTPEYRKPFNILAITNAVYQKEKAVSGVENGLRSVWLPGPDSNQRQGG